MGRRIRRQKKDRIYSVVNRTLHSKYFFAPDDEVNAIILGLLAKMADRYDIEIFAFVFMSNHFHMLVRSKSLQLHLFMRDFQGQLARKLNRHWGRTGTFFQGRYSATPILDDEAMVDKIVDELSEDADEASDQISLGSFSRWMGRAYSSYMHNPELVKDSTAKWREEVYNQ